MKSLSFKTRYSSVDTIKLTNADGKKLADSALVPNAAEVTLTAYNPDTGVTVGEVYTVIVLGDVNRNGRDDSGDAKLMLDHYMGRRTLTGYDFMAADINRNGRIESGDAVKNTVKYNRPADYKTDLK